MPSLKYTGLQRLYTLLLWGLPSLYRARGPPYLGNLTPDAAKTGSIPTKNLSPKAQFDSSVPRKSEYDGLSNINNAEAHLSTEGFDKCLKEWRQISGTSSMLLLGSLLLLSTRNSEFAEDPVARTLALSSLILAFWSMVYGSVYVLQSRRVIPTWTKETGNANEGFWNVWVMMALPAAWLAWSLVAFMATVGWLIWRTYINPSFDLTLSSTAESGLRGSILILWTVGLAYFVLVVTTSTKTPRSPPRQQTTTETLHSN